MVIIKEKGDGFVQYKSIVDGITERITLQSWRIDIENFRSLIRSVGSNIRFPKSEESVCIRNIHPIKIVVVMIDVSAVLRQSV
ncbi:hypothetical protein D3C86_1378680 [compost metagenome]